MGIVTVTVDSIFVPRFRRNKRAINSYEIITLWDTMLNLCLKQLLA